MGFYRLFIQEMALRFSSIIFFNSFSIDRCEVSSLDGVIKKVALSRGDLEQNVQQIKN